MRTLLEGQSAAAVFPTGGGKSLCYQLPALLLPGVTLVVSPLIALMKDQIDALSARGIAAARLDSSLDWEDYQRNLAGARQGSLKLLYVSPERFNNERFRHSLASLNLSLFAVDEAHCVSEWGHNFRPDYLKLAGYAKHFGAERILALTATATPRVLHDICDTFEIAPERAVRTAFYRPNLILLTGPVRSRDEKLERLVENLQQRPSGATIIYVTLQKTALWLAEELAHRGLEAKPYHAGLDHEVRRQTQESFLADQTQIVVATIAFGMGIDKPDIRFVYHFDPPKSLENYAQEIGRAGRDGEPSTCQAFLYPPDLIPLENFVYGDTPTRSAIAGLVTDLFGQKDEFVLNLNELSKHHDLRPLVLRTILTYLELDGWLEARTPIYGSYKFKPILSSREILAKFEGERRQFLIGLFKQAVKKRVWCEIDLDQTSQALGCPRERVVKALDYQSQQGWLELKAAGLRHRYRVADRPADLISVTDSLHQKALQRERAELMRLRQAVELITEPGCRSERLSAHFGETVEPPCGHCSWCLGQHQKSDGSDSVQPLLELPSLPSELRHPRAVARFLCGVGSPHLTRNQLHRHPEFGSLAEVSFGQVLELAEKALAKGHHA